MKTALKTLDANDYLYWFESSWDYDPEPALGQIKARIMAVNFADDLINASELGVMDKLMPRLPQARSVLVPRGPQTIGHQTLTQAVVWKPYLEELLRTLPTPPHE
jgi:homoserine O-acetyltransferase